MAVSLAGHVPHRELFIGPHYVCHASVRKVLQVPSLIALGLVECQVVAVGRVNRSRIILLSEVGEVPSTFNRVLHLLLCGLVHELGLIVGALGRVHLPLVLSHHKSVLLDLSILGVCQALKIGVHILSLVRLVLMVTIFLMPVLLSLSDTRLIAANFHLLRDIAISEGREFLLRSLVTTFWSLSHWREN